MLTALPLLGSYLDESIIIRSCITGRSAASCDLLPVLLPPHFRPIFRFRPVVIILLLAVTRPTLLLSISIRRLMDRRPACQASNLAFGCGL